MNEICAGRTLVGFNVWEDVARAFPGRSAVACRQRWFGLRAKTAGKPPRDRSRERQANGRIRRTRDEVLAAERAARQEPIPAFARPSHKSITAFVFGDPLPGRSALDQRNTTTTGENHASHN